MAQAEQIAIDVLSWLAGDPELFNRFIGLSGIEPSQIREAANEPGFLAGVLGFLINHEPTLVRYCESANERPEAIARAYKELGGDLEQGY